MIYIPLSVVFCSMWTWSIFQTNDANNVSPKM